MVAGWCLARLVVLKVCKSTFRTLAKHNHQKETIYDTVTKLPFKGLLLDNNKS
jgi:hypothetical protein